MSALEPRLGQSVGAPALGQQVGRWLSERGIMGVGVLVGVSGGPDSVALLRALDQCRGTQRLDVWVAHLDHGLRPDSDGDARWVSRLSSRLGLPVLVERLDVGRVAAETGRGIEESARRARLEFFRRAAAQHRCSCVAVAHTSDDQAETILHHLLRGTGLAGLRGMPDERPLSPEVKLIRPLLAVSRNDVLRFLDGLGQDVRQDESNADERFTRNRLRRMLLPLLKEQFNPDVTGAIVRLGRQAADAQRIIEQLAGQGLAGAVVSRTVDSAALNVTPLAHLNPHLVREVFRLLWSEQQWPAQHMGFDEWDRLAALVRAATQATSFDLPHGVTATRIADRIVLTRTAPGV